MATDYNQNGIDDQSEILQLQQLQAQGQLSREQMSKMFDSEEKNNDFLRWALDLDPLLEYLKRRFLCQELDEEGQWFTPEHTSPLMNLTGATMVTAFISSYLSKPGTFTNLSTEEVNQLMYDFTIEIIKHIALNYDKYEIKKNDLTMIETMCTSMVKMVLKMSYQKGVQDWTKPGIGRQEIYHHLNRQQQQPNYSFMR